MKKQRSPPDVESDRALSDITNLGKIINTNLLVKNMTERGEIYNHNGKPAMPNLQSRELAQKFVTAIGEYNWKTDYLKFCSLLELEPGDFADEQYRRFQQLALALTWFDAQSLGKMIDAGEGK